MKSKSTVSRTKTTSKKTQPRAEPVNDTAPPKHECAKYMDTMVDGSEVCSVCGTYPPLHVPLAAKGRFYTNDEIEGIKEDAVEKHVEDFWSTREGRVSYVRDRFRESTVHLLQIVNRVDLLNILSKDRKDERLIEVTKMTADQVREDAFHILWDLYCECDEALPHLQASDEDLQRRREQSAKVAS